MSILQLLDWIIIAGYFAIILALAWWVIKLWQEDSIDLKGH